MTKYIFKILKEKYKFLLTLIIINALIISIVTTFKSTFSNINKTLIMGNFKIFLPFYYEKKDIFYFPIKKFPKLTGVYETFATLNSTPIKLIGKTNQKKFIVGFELYKKLFKNKNLPQTAILENLDTKLKVTIENTFRTGIYEIDSNIAIVPINILWKLDDLPKNTFSYLESKVKLNIKGFTRKKTINKFKSLIELSNFENKLFNIFIIFILILLIWSNIAMLLFIFNFLKNKLFILKFEYFKSTRELKSAITINLVLIYFLSTLLSIVISHIFTSIVNNISIPTFVKELYGISFLNVSIMYNYIFYTNLILLITSILFSLTIKI